MPLTLRPCLESVAQLGTDYVGTDQGTEWTPREMVAALTRDSPDHLDRLMYLRLPASQQDGAICELTRVVVFSCAITFAATLHVGDFQSSEQDYSSSSRRTARS